MQPGSTETASGGADTTDATTTAGDARKPPVVANLVEAYIRERLQRHEIAPITARNIRTSLTSLGRVTGNRPVGRLSRSDIERWLATRQGKAASTRRSDLSEVKSFCRWLVRRRYIRVDPTAELPAIRIPRYLPRALPREKITKLISTLPDPRAVLMCLLMVQEGLRCGEVSVLELGDLDFNQRTARVVGKGGHERFLPLSDETWQALAIYLRDHPATSGPLIRSYRQEWRALQADTISGMVSTWMSSAGIKRYRRDGVSAHALRHSAATDMLRGGAHLRDVQHALGHAHLATTEVYLPLVVHDLREAMGGRSYR
ncbi:MAG TPA: tyrosine-type recombinase/integrase [Acidimicrobiales bacterium]|nr:tyrosine-type recombinase/integrase [Acidimicrobiales bacterium]